MFIPGLVYRLRNDTMISYFVVMNVVHKPDGTTLIEQTAFTAEEKKHSTLRDVKLQSIENRVVKNAEESFKKLFDYVKKDLYKKEFDFFLGRTYIAAANHARENNLKLTFLLTRGIVPHQNCVCTD